MILDPDYERRVVDEARACTHDIEECARADVSVFWKAGIPFLRFVFASTRIPIASPALAVQLKSESRSAPLTGGSLVEGERFKRHVRASVENYFKAYGLEITRKGIVDDGLSLML